MRSLAGDPAAHSGCHQAALVPCQIPGLDRAAVVGDAHRVRATGPLAEHRLVAAIGDQIARLAAEGHRQRPVVTGLDDAPVGIAAQEPGRKEHRDVQRFAVAGRHKDHQPPDTLRAPCCCVPLDLLEMLGQQVVMGSPLPAAPDISGEFAVLTAGQLTLGQFAPGASQIITPNRHHHLTLQRAH